MRIFVAIFCESCGANIDETGGTQIEGLGSGRWVCETCWQEN